MKKRENKNSMYTVVISICVVLAVVLVLYFGGRLKNNDDSSSNGSIYSEYAGDYGIRMTFVDEEGTTDNADYVLNLREDGTFKYNVNNYVESTPTVGTYKVDGKKITLTEKIRYGSDACYYTDKLRTITANIKEDGVLVVNDNYYVGHDQWKQTDLEFFKNEIYREDPDWRAYFVTKPVNGKKATMDTETWTDCTGQE